MAEQIEKVFGTNDFREKKPNLAMLLSGKPDGAKICHLANLKLFLNLNLPKCYNSCPMQLEIKKSCLTWGSTYSLTISLILSCKAWIGYFKLSLKDFIVKLESVPIIITINLGLNVKESLLLRALHNFNFKPKLSISGCSTLAE